MIGKKEEYLTVLTFRNGVAKIKASAIKDVIACSLKEVQERDPSSPLYFSFNDEDLALEKEGETYVCKVFLIYSSFSDEKKIGEAVFEAARDALKVAFPKFLFRIVLSGKKV